MSIQILDCTLRDGAHVNSGQFGKEHIINIIEKLTSASVDYIEIGFLKNIEYDVDVTSYPTMDEAYEMISKIPKKEGIRYSLMARADQFDMSELPDCDGRIEMIRVAFYYDYLEKAMEFAKKIKKKGYLFTLNLINTPGNELDDLEKLIDYSNEVKPHAVTIVDTFGVLDVNKMKEIAMMYNKKLNPDIKMGLHVHENMALAFSLAKEFAEEISINRDIIIDGSLMGMGRAPGNLCIELIGDYLNDAYNKNYDLKQLLSTISSDILPIRRKYRWGYSPEFFLSAKYHVHRSYAEYLYDKGYELDTINHFLSKIDKEHSYKYDLEYLKTLIKEA